MLHRTAAEGGSGGDGRRRVLHQPPPHTPASEQSAFLLRRKLGEPRGGAVLRLDEDGHARAYRTGFAVPEVNGGPRGVALSSTSCRPAN